MLSIRKVINDIKKYQKEHSFMNWFKFLEYIKLSNSELLVLKEACIEGDKEAIKVMNLLIQFKQYIEGFLMDILLYQGAHPFFEKNRINPKYYNFKLIETLLKEHKKIDLGYEIKSNDSAFNPNKKAIKLKILENESDLKLLK